MKVTDEKAKTSKEQLLELIKGSEDGMTVNDLLMYPEWMEERGGALALRCMALCRAGLLKTDGKRDGKTIFIIGDGTKLPITRRKKIEVENTASKDAKTPVELPQPKSPVAEISEENTSQAFKSGYAVISHLLEAKRHLDDFVEGFKRAIEG